jgi:hypothetical protein
MADFKVSRRGTGGTGRFGGGWQWKVGFQASAGFRDIIINLLTFSVRITRRER